jgi:tRNA A64-2'-O-ribosylphosphate transferase
MPSLSEVEKELRREQNSTYNCLLSILDDSRFVDEIISLYPGLPVFANLRCGLWYLRNPQQTCYFKSTDGHCGQWSFSLTRLNLHVATAVREAGGCIIVDATRRGKTFPARFLFFANAPQRQLS